MEVILRQDYPSLGFIGDKISVKKGYARNYLIPSGFAVEANSQNVGWIAHQLRQINAAKAQKKKDAEGLAAKLSSVVAKCTLKIGENGKAFGSITSKDIAEALAKAENGLVIDRKQIVLSEPIKSAGEHTINVKLHSEVNGSFKLQVAGDIIKVAKYVEAPVVEEAEEETDGEE